MEERQVVMPQTFAVVHCIFTEHQHTFVSHILSITRVGSLSRLLLLSMNRVLTVVQQVSFNPISDLANYTSIVSG